MTTLFAPSNGLFDAVRKIPFAKELKEVVITAKRKSTPIQIVQPEVKNGNLILIAILAVAAFLLVKLSKL